MKWKVCHYVWDGFLFLSLVFLNNGLENHISERLMCHQSNSESKWTGFSIKESKQTWEAQYRHTKACTVFWLSLQCNIMLFSDSDVTSFPVPASVTSNYELHTITFVQIEKPSAYLNTSTNRHNHSTINSPLEARSRSELAIWMCRVQSDNTPELWGIWNAA